MKYFSKALCIGPLSRPVWTVSEEERAELEQVGRDLLGDQAFSLPDPTTATPEELEAAKEGVFVVILMLRERVESLRAQMAETEARGQELLLEAIIPHVTVGLKRRKQLKAFGDIHGKQRHLAALEEHKPWIKEARSLWAKNRHLSVRRVAERVVEKLRLPATELSAVRKAIAAHKPTR